MTMGYSSHTRNASSRKKTTSKRGKPSSGIGSAMGRKGISGAYGKPMKMSLSSRRSAGRGK